MSFPTFFLTEKRGLMLLGLEYSLNMNETKALIPLYSSSSHYTGSYRTLGPSPELLLPQLLDSSSKRVLAIFTFSSYLDFYSFFVCSNSPAFVITSHYLTFNIYLQTLSTFQTHKFTRFNGCKMFNFVFLKIFRAMKISIDLYKSNIDFPFSILNIVIPSYMCRSHIKLDV